MADVVERWARGLGTERPFAVESGQLLDALPVAALVAVVLAAGRKGRARTVREGNEMGFASML